MEAETKTIDILMAEVLKLNDKYNTLSQASIVHSSNIDYLKLAIENININVEKLSKVFTDTNGSPSFASRLNNVEEDLTELVTNIKDKEKNNTLNKEAKITIFISLAFGILGIISTVFAAMH